MSLSSSRVGYRHRCTIERRTESVDQWGNPTHTDWQDHLTDLPCRAWTNSAKEPVDDARTVVVTDRRISVPVGTDVTEADRVKQVTERGTEIYDGPMQIEGVLRYSDHIELIVQRID